MAGRPPKFRAVILDVDGVIWISGALAPNARELLASLSRQRCPFCLLTNGCNVSKATRFNTLVQAGLSIRPDQLVTAPEVTNEWLVQASAQRIIYLGSPDALLDFAPSISIKDCGAVDAVVVGDLFDAYNRGAIEKAVKAIVGGAQLVAMQRSRRWFDGSDWYVDNGFWVAGLEYVSGSEAVVTGKPSRTAYLAALRRLGKSSRDNSDIAFVSDDIEGDLKGGKAVGLTTVHLGPPGNLAEWVDFDVKDVASLRSFLAQGRDA